MRWMLRNWIQTMHKSIHMMFLFYLDRRYQHCRLAQLLRTRRTLIRACFFPMLGETLASFPTSFSRENLSVVCFHADGGVAALSLLYVTPLPWRRQEGKWQRRQSEQSGANKTAAKTNLIEGWRRRRSDLLVSSCLTTSDMSEWLGRWEGAGSVLLNESLRGEEIEPIDPDHVTNNNTLSSCLAFSCCLQQIVLCCVCASVCVTTANSTTRQFFMRDNIICCVIQQLIIIINPARQT